MQERSEGKSILEQYGGKLVPIYLTCGFDDFKMHTLGKVNPETYKIKEKSVRNKLKREARQHFLNHSLHQIFYTYAMLSPKNEPIEIVFLKDTFRF